MDKQLTLTEGSILKPLFYFALPILLALFLQAMYGAVDLIIVGQFCMPEDVSAVAIGSQVMQTLTLVIVGLSMGITILVGRKIGQGLFNDAGKIIGASIYLFFIISIIVTIAMIAMASPIASIMHTPLQAFDLTVIYVQICSAGTVFIIAYNVFGSVLRGVGNSRLPLYTAAIACICNIIGDLLFVAVFNMGVAGAAIATVLAQAISVILSLLIARHVNLPISFHLSYIRFNSKITKKVLRLGSPVALQDLLVNISFLVILAIVNSLGVIFSAGVGVAEKICAFIMLVPSAYMQYMAVFTAQNLGAKKPDRVFKALGYTIISSLFIGTILGFVSFFHGDILAMIFSTDAQIILATAEYLKAYAIDCFLVSMLFCFVGYFNGHGKTLFVMIQGIFGAFAIRIPVSYFMSQMNDPSLFYIGLASPASTSVQVFLCLCFFIYLYKLDKKKQTPIQQILYNKS